MNNSNMIFYKRDKYKYELICLLNYNNDGHVMMMQVGLYSIEHIVRLLLTSKDKR